MIQKRIQLLMISLMLIVGSTRAQYTLTAYSPPSDFTFESLWHFTINGPATSDYSEFYVALRIFNEQNSLLLKSNSTVFAIPTGNMYVNVTSLSQVQPFNTLYYDNTYQSIVANGSFFPAGTYNIVLTLLGRPVDGEFTELSEASYSITVTVFMPPLLIHPEDQDTIDTPFPILMWLPAYQAAVGQTILYDLRLTEKFSGQTAQQSITANPVYFNQSDIPITSLNYPAAANPIQLNHTYAWQVAATINGYPVAYSQIWEFTYALPDSVIPDTRIRAFAHTSQQVDAGFHVALDNRLRFIYNAEEYVPEIGDSLRFKIYRNQDGVVVKKTGDNIYYGPYVIKYGENRYVFELGACGLNLEPEKYYMLEISNLKGVKKYLVFYNPIVETNTICGDEE